MAERAPERRARLIQAGRAPPRCSAAFLALLAFDAQGRPRKGLQPCFADRLSARFACPVGTLVNPGQRPLGLREQFAGVVGQRKLMLALICFRTDIRLIVPGVADRVTEPIGDVRLGPVNVGAQLSSLGGQRLTAPSRARTRSSAALPAAPEARLRPNARLQSFPASLSATRATILIASSHRRISGDRVQLQTRRQRHGGKNAARTARPADRREHSRPAIGYPSSLHGAERDSCHCSGAERPGDGASPGTRRSGPDHPGAAGRTASRPTGRRRPRPTG